MSKNPSGIFLTNWDVEWWATTVYYKKDVLNLLYYWSIWV